MISLKSYVFSFDIMESLEKQQRENTETILEKARAICREKNVSILARPVSIFIGDLPFL